MATTTPIFGLNKPAYKDPRWDIPYNENVDMLEALLAQTTASFVAADLTDGILTFSHQLNVDYPAAVAVWDNNRRIVIPSEITSIDADTITVDLAAFGTISGTWNITVRR